ncbi:MAG: protein kinase [Blastocatellia bacterium]|nr:protein kinase [Blastocatellia bacterium]
MTLTHVSPVNPAWIAALRRFLEPAPLLLSLLFWCLSPVWALAPNRLPIHTLRTTWQDELPQNTINTLCQTRDGFLWIGTYEGLVRFDGVTFTVFNRTDWNSEGTGGSGVLAVCEDRRGRLWVGTNGGGLVCYENKRFRTLTTKDGLAHNTVNWLCEDRNGALWIATNGGLNIWNEGKITTFLSAENNANRAVRVVLADPQGGVWAALMTGGIWRFLDSSFRMGADGTLLAGKQVFTLTWDRSGNLWAGTEQGELFRHAASGGFEETNFGLPKNRIRALLEDRDGNFWIGTDAKGVFRWSNGKLVQFSTAEGLSNDQVYCILEDLEGSLWIGVNGGLTCMRDGKFVTLGKESGLPGEQVRTIFEDPDHNLWVGMDGNGVSCLRDWQVVKTIGLQDGLPSANVRSVWMDRNHVLWVGTIAGLAKVENGKVTAYSTKDGLAYDQINVLYEDATGRIWIGTRDGVNYLENGTFKTVPLTNVLNRYVRMIHVDAKGRLWVGTNSGLVCVDRDWETTYTVKNGLANDVVLACYEDPRTGDLWFGTNGGLHRFRNGTFTCYSTAAGLFDSTAFQIRMDTAGTLWMTCNKGIYAVPKQAFDDFDAKRISRLPCQVFGKGDGMRASQCNGATQPSGWTAHDGRIYFPTIRGLVVIDPHHIPTNQLPPPVAVTKVIADGSPVTDAALLNPGTENCEFHYSGLSFITPERVQFQYRLEGFDTNWIDAGNRRAAYYTNLPPGNYAFRVKACNADGVWNETGTVFRFRLKPHWWETPWAWLGGLLLLGGGIFGGFRWRLHALRLQTLKLEGMVAQRTTELASTIDELQAAKTDLETKKQEAESKNAALEHANREIERQNSALVAAKAEVESKNSELDRRIADLVASQQQADRIFSALAEALPGTILDGKYRLDEKIGGGGFGVVFKSTHLVLDRPIAVKVFRPSPGNDSADAVERFKMEGVSASRLSHPNAIQVLDSGISPEGIAYLVMELLTGDSLAEELGRNHRLTLRRAAEIILPVCDSLAEAHRLGIIHRDIKPDNIFLNQTPAGEVVKVVDFGIAKLLGEETSEKMQNLTATGGIIGTPTYMSPERLSGASYDGRADVYSLGVMLYEMLTGRRPFVMGTTGFFSLVMAHLQTPPPPLRTVLPDFPEKVEAVVLAALKKKPEDRPTATEFHELFSASLTGLAPEDLDRTWTAETESEKTATEDTSEMPLALIANLPTMVTPTTKRPYVSLETIETDPPQFTIKTEK